MHQDQKIGLSLAVLLIGFASAFCFRNEGLLQPHAPTLDHGADLDLKIEPLSVRSYTEREGVRLTEDSKRPHRDVAADGPLSDVLEIGVVRPEAGRTDARESGIPLIHRLPLFAGPPEPLRVGPKPQTFKSRTSAGIETSFASDSLPPPASIAQTQALSARLPSRDNAAREEAARTDPQPGASTGSFIKDQEISRNDVSEHALVPSLSKHTESTTYAGETPQPGVSPKDLRTTSRSHMKEPTFTYEVRSGDTLSGLASRFLGSSARYQELFEANRDVLSSPDFLRTGMILRIPSRPDDQITPD